MEERKIVFGAKIEEAMIISLGWEEINGVITGYKVFAKGSQRILWDPKDKTVVGVYENIVK